MPPRFPENFVFNNSSDTTTLIYLGSGVAPVVGNVVVVGGATPPLLG